MKSVLRHLKHLNRLRIGHQPIFLEYPVDLRPRWQTERGNPHLAKLIEARRDVFRTHLETIAQLLPTILCSSTETLSRRSINWTNSFIPALDGLTLMWAARHTRKTFLEVGSGNSTAFVRAAFDLEQSQAKLISIDPHPREDIDRLCDVVIREPLERTDLSVFDQLEAGDVLFIDNSHRSFMNSDVTVIMLEIIPRLSKGVLIGFHDIFLPYDYFESWAERAYNEQYLLACYLLANAGYLEIELANYWVWRQKLHHDPLRETWAHLGATIRDRPPSAFWLTKKG